MGCLSRRRLTRMSCDYRRSSGRSMRPSMKRVKGKGVKGLMAGTCTGFRGYVIPGVR